jgi:hypothetical protein
MEWGPRRRAPLAPERTQPHRSPLPRSPPLRPSDFGLPDASPRARAQGPYAAFGDRPRAALPAARRPRRRPPGPRSPPPAHWAVSTPAPPRRRAHARPARPCPCPPGAAPVVRSAPSRPAPSPSLAPAPSPSPSPSPRPHRPAVDVITSKRARSAITRSTGCRAGPAQAGAGAAGPPRGWGSRLSSAARAHGRPRCCCSRRSAVRWRGARPQGRPAGHAWQGGFVRHGGGGGQHAPGSAPCAWGGQHRGGACARRRGVCGGPSLAYATREGRGAYA